MAEQRWSETPSFRLRRGAILDHTRDWAPGRFLECGTGTGTMTREFLERNFTGWAYDIAIENLRVLESRLAAHRPALSTTDSLEAIEHERFDYLFAFEVLEHIADDHAALVRWTRHLEPGGRLLVSVPARMKYYREDDRLVGHQRRYERVELARLLERAGYEDIRISSYGVPLMNLSRRIGASLQGGAARHHESAKEALSIASGISRPGLINRLSQFVGPRAIRPFLSLQRRFYRSDVGEGYVATAVRAASATTASCA